MSCVLLALRSFYRTSAKKTAPGFGSGAVLLLLKNEIIRN